MSLVLLVHAAATLYMTGLIWFVQVVHYPLMARVGVDGYSGYQRFHQTLTGLVVGPPMLAESVTALLLVAYPPPRIGMPGIILGLLLVTGLWLSTWLLQVPQHNLLALGFDPVAHHRLVATNWLRTFLWTSRAILVLWMLKSSS